MSALLTVLGISKTFGGFRAVDGMDLAIEAGERHAVIGPNGAGKTTFFNLLTGLLRPDGGSVKLANNELIGLPPHRIAAAGVSRAFQITNIFGRLTVRQNVQIALLAASGQAFRPWGNGWAEKVDEADTILGEVGLAGAAESPAATLSHGDQRAIELAIALAHQPRLLILDEPTAGMAPAETGRTMELIRRVVAERAITLLFSEHDMDVVFGTADRITVMSQGRVLAEGTPDEVRADPSVRAVYLGTGDVAG
jgi:branched-chain amino acid transport system ATP-binding protein